jgi:hypothetical protein
VESEAEFDLRDVSDLTQLASYAAVAQICFLTSDLVPAPRRMSQNKIAQKWRKKNPPREKAPARSGEAVEGAQDQKRQDNNASTQFSRKLRKPDAKFLREVDEILIRRAPVLLRAGGLAPFHARLHGVRSPDNPTAVISPLYAAPLLLEKPDEAIVVLLQASALLDRFQDDDHRQFGMSPDDRQALQTIVKGLILIGGLPPTPYSVDALLFLGSLSRFEFSEVSRLLEEALRSPLGFRMWRAITAIVAAVRDHKETDAKLVRDVREWVKNQLDLCERLREYSLYPARSLDLELAIAVPAQWSNPDTHDWAGDVLRTRARDKRATLRERGTAAFGLWERAIRSKDEEWIEAARIELSHLTEAFLQEADERPGISWVANVLRENVHQKRAILTDWPDLEEPAQKLVAAAADQLTDVPARIRGATGKLVEHAVLKNAGVYRRRAIDTLRAGGFGVSAARALGAVLRRGAAAPSWLRVRVLFAIGFLQERGPDVQEALRSACTSAWNDLQKVSPADGHRYWVRAIELHAAIFAIGDCFGDPAAKNEAEAVRATIDDLLTSLIAEVKNDDAGHLTSIGRAIAYLVGSTAHVNVGSSRRLLTELAGMRDKMTSTLGAWGLQRLGDSDTDPVLPAHSVGFPRLDINV